MSDEQIYSKVLTKQIVEDPPPPLEPEKPSEPVQRKERKPWKEYLPKIQWTKRTIFYLVAGGVGALFLTLFVFLPLQFHWSWTTWQWMLGSVGGIALVGGLGYLTYYLNDNDYISYPLFGALLLCTLSALNYFFFVLFRENYKILFSWLCSWGAMSGGFFTVLLVRNGESDKVLSLLAGFWNVFGVLFSFFDFYKTNWVGAQWVLGVIGGAFLFFILFYFYKYCTETLLWNEYILGAVMLGALLVANLLLLFGLLEDYQWIFTCVTAFEIAGGIILAHKARQNYDTAWASLFIVEIVLSAVQFLLLLFGITAWRWQVTQWVIGILGSLSVLAVCVSIYFILQNALGWELFPVATADIGGFFLLNVLAYLFIGADYRVIFLIFNVVEALLTVISTIYCLIASEYRWSFAFLGETVALALATILGILGFQEWGWMHWQLIIGVVTCIIIVPPLFLLVRYLDEEGIVDKFGSTYLLFIVMLGINLFLAVIFKSDYEIIYCCVSMLCLLASIIMERLASHDGNGESWVKYYRYETIANAVLMVIVLSTL